MRYRPTRDAPSTLRDLLEAVPPRPNPLSVRWLIDQIQILYLLQHALTLNNGAIAEPLKLCVDALPGLPHNGVEIGTVEQTEAGMLVNNATMWPRSAGIRVSQPLGVCIRSRQDHVIEKAQVLCR